MFYIKLETKSEGVKGVSFHRKRPWILASLESGFIELWDYRRKTLIERFQGHHGPACTVHFHNTRPLFVSGGDDCKIKIWNYELHQCSFTLLGHLSCIRTVQFHHECPWIVSASDDHTIRIWDWQSRTCISVLKGHKHCVTCASFHPKLDFVLSGSHDLTAMLWDISALRKKTASPPANEMAGASVRQVMRHFNSAVYWASFHPTRGYATVVDSYYMRLYIVDDYRAWRTNTLGNHEKSISCVLFPKQDKLLISCSEDKSIRVWIWNSYMWEHIDTFFSEHDRFWILASHPEMNLLAAGHDHGMIVFKLVRERPAFSVSGGNLFYMKGGRFLHKYKYSTQEDTKLIKIRRCYAYNKALNQGPRTLSYSPSDNAVLICLDVDGGSYELHSVDAAMGHTIKKSKGGRGRSAVFVGKNKFAVLMKSTNEVLIKNLNDETVQKSPLPSATDEIIYAGSGQLLCRGQDRVHIFDLQQRIVLGSLQTSSFIKYVVWSCDMERAAFLCKQSIVFANKNLMHHCTVHETVRIKSGAWDDSGEVFIYTTHMHIKYCLLNGDSGIIESIGVPMYITKVHGNTIFCLDRDGENHSIVIDSTEYTFKLSLLRKRHDQVISIIGNNSEQLCDNQAMIAYLQQKGYQKIALCLAKDEHARFNLALESGNIKIALESAKKIDKKDHWYRLGVEALRYGNAGVAEYAYQKTQNSFERLSFLYLITGKLDKLLKMIKTAEIKYENIMSQFHSALYLGNVDERVKVLENAGSHMLPLAYITAAVHRLNDDTTAKRLAKELGDNVPSMPKGKRASMLLPPTPILAGGDWPILMVTEGISEDGLSTSYLKESSPRVRMRIELIESEKSSHLNRRRIKK